MTDTQTKRRTDKYTDIATYRLNRPKGRFSEIRFLLCVLRNSSTTTYYRGLYQPFFPQELLAVVAGKRVQCNMGAKNHGVIMPDANKEYTINQVAQAESLRAPESVPLFLRTYQHLELGRVALFCEMVLNRQTNRR